MVEMSYKGDLSSLTAKELREQLVLCWDHFRRCMSALSGEEVEPCELFCCDELGDSDDLELFYACKQIGVNVNNHDVN